MWLIDEHVGKTLQQARRSRIQPTAQQLEALSKNEAVAADQLPRGMSIAGSTAEIRIEGVLTKAPDFFSMFFGGGNTTYRSIVQALSLALNDPAIKNVVLYVDSPGGTVDGLFDTIAAIEAFRGKKPLTVRAANALSAAYGIAAAAGKIEATGVASNFGSVGTAISYFVDEEVVDLTNTDSPDKRPDPTTPEGKAVIVRYLDAVNDLFVDAIARGRGGDVTADDVRQKFGRGATLLAGEAKKRGMIDSIAKAGLRAVGGAQQQFAASAEAEQASEAANRQQQGEIIAMDIKQLRAQHPDLFEQVVQQGVAQERDRVCAHLKMAEELGEEGHKAAVSAIRSGDTMSMTMHATYLSIGLNRGARGARQQESDAAGAAADGATPPPAAASADGKQTPAPQAQQPDMGDKVVDILRKKGMIKHA